MSQIIINVEAQKDEPNGYDILNRAIFYVSRMISSQKERDFSNSNYNDIKRVSWISGNANSSGRTNADLYRNERPDEVFFFCNQKEKSRQGDCGPTAGHRGNGLCRTVSYILQI